MGVYSYSAIAGVSNSWVAPPGVTYVDWDFGSIWHHDYRGSLNDGYPQFEITAPSAVKKFIFKVPYKI